LWGATTDRGFVVPRNGNRILRVGDAANTESVDPSNC